LLLWKFHRPGEHHTLNRRKGLNLTCISKHTNVATVRARAVGLTSLSTYPHCEGVSAKRWPRLSCKLNCVISDTPKYYIRQSADRRLSWSSDCSSRTGNLSSSAFNIVNNSNRSTRRNRKGGQGFEADNNEQRIRFLKFPTFQSCLIHGPKIEIVGTGCLERIVALSPHRAAMSPFQS
jgi:hypothetical protein